MDSETMDNLEEESIESQANTSAETQDQDNDKGLLSKYWECDILPLKTEETTFEVAKGFTILLLIIANMHISELLGYSVVGFINALVFPTFFFLAGYAFTRSYDARGTFGAFFKRIMLTLFIPYTLFFMLSFIWTQTVYATAMGVPLFDFDFTWAEILRAYVFSGKYLYEFPLAPFPLWLLHALFFASIGFYFLVKIKSVTALTLLAFALSFITIPFQDALADTPYWAVSMLPVSLCFMLFGYLFWGFTTLDDGARAFSEEEEKKRRVASSTFGALASLGLFFLSMNLYVYGGGNMWEITEYWYFFAAFVGMIAVFLFCNGTNSLLLRFFGRRSLLYLGLHIFILQMPFMVSLPEWLEGQHFDGFLIFAGYLLVALIMISILVFLVNLLIMPINKMIAKRAFAKEEKRALEKALEAEAVEQATVIEA